MFKKLIYTSLTLCVIFAFAWALALSRMAALPFWMLFVDGGIHAVLFLGIIAALWKIIRYGNYSALSVYQRIINYFAMGVLSVALWLVAGYGVFYLAFGNDYITLIINMLWLKAFVGALMYLLVVQYLYYQNTETKTLAETEDFSEEKQEEIPYKPTESEILERVAVKSGQKINVIPISEIIYLQADGDYVRIHTEKGKFLKEETMKFFQEHLPPKQFARVHRSYIVNVEMIHRIEVHEKQNQLITLKNGEKIKASIAGYKQLRAALGL